MRYIVFICSIFLFFSCGFGYRVDYTNAEPIIFNINVENKSTDSKIVLFERTRADNDEYLVLGNSIKELKDIVCIDSRWEENFRDVERPGMFKESVISISVEDKKVEIGEFNVNCRGKNPTTYGEFITGELTGVETGTVELKLTINEDGTLKLEYPNIN